MAKKPSSLLRKKAVQEGFIQITEKNKKFCCVLGRIIYVLKKNYMGDFNILNVFDIRPRMKRGTYIIEGTHQADSFECWVFEEEEMEDYQDLIKEVINDGILKEKLFIKKDQPLAKYHYKPMKR